MSDELKPEGDGVLEGQTAPEDVLAAGLEESRAANLAASVETEPLPGGDILNLDKPLLAEEAALEDFSGESAAPGNDGPRRGPERLELDPAAALHSAKAAQAAKQQAKGSQTAASGTAPGQTPAATAAATAAAAPYGCSPQPTATAAGNVYCCPAAAVLQEVLKQRKGWIRRHPIIFFLLLLACLFVLINILGVIAAYVTKQGPFAENRLAVVRVEGMILDSAPVLKWCRSLEDDESVRGVLLYINSPGGAVVPSQELYAGLKRLAAKKPMVAYLSSTAASGGYYAAMAAPHIIASPSTLTGSIGVRMELAEMKDMFDWLGIHSQSLASGDFKEAGTPFRPMRDDERAYLRGLVQDMHDCFVQDVAAARALPLEKVQSLADGRAYTGRQALGLKLVDQLGDSNLAWNELKQRCGLEEEPGEYLDGPPKETSWLRELVSGSLEALDQLRLESARPSFGFYY